MRRRKVAHGYTANKLDPIMTRWYSTSVTMQKELFLEIDGLARSKGISRAALVRELVEYALLELEEQGEHVLNKRVWPET